jgi:hypothetical protein
MAVSYAPVSAAASSVLPPQNVSFNGRLLLLDII